MAVSLKEFDSCELKQFQNVTSNQKTCVCKIVTIHVGQQPVHIQSSLDAFGIGRALVPTFENSSLALWRTSNMDKQSLPQHI